MKTKKFVSLILALLMVLTLFSGCKEEAPDASQPSESVGTDHTDSTEASTPNLEYPLPTETIEAVNGVYVTCENYDFTIYKGMHPSCELHFMLMSEKPLPEDAQLILTDVQTQYRVGFQRRTRKDLFTGFGKVMYEYVQNPDFTAEDYFAYYEELDEAQKKRNDLWYLLYGEDGRQPGETYPADHEYAEEFEQADKYLEEVSNRYQEAYDQFLATAPQPEYCVYDVVIFFKSGVTEEQIKTMELIAGDMSRTITMKNVWIKPYDASTLKRRNVKISSSPRNPVTGDDVAQTLPEVEEYLAAQVTFVANEDITLKRIYPYGDNTRITAEKMEVVLFDKNGFEIHTEWIEGQDFLIRKGEQATIWIYWDDPLADLIHYGMNASFVIEYTCNEETCQMWSFISYYSNKVTKSQYLYYLKAIKGVAIDDVFFK